MATIGLYCKESDQTRTMQDVIEKAGHRVVFMHSREELFLLVTQEPIQVFIIDFETPDKRNGFLVARDLRERPDGRNISIILRIDPTDDLSKEISSQGVNDFLLTPFHEDEFLSLVDRFLHVEKRRPFQSLIRIITKEKTFMGKTLNISASGCLVQLPNEMKLGTPVTVDFFLPHSKEEIKCEAVLRRRAHERLTFNPCYGVEFNALTDDQRAKLESFAKRW